MSGAELGLAIFAVIDLCFKYGSNLSKLCASVKGAEADIAERVLAIESCWKRTSLQLDFLRRVWRHLDEEHRSIQNQILQVLVTKLTVATSKIEVLTTGDNGSLLSKARDYQPQLPGVRKWKYALLKEGLDKTIGDLERWQKLFDPSWFLILMASNPQIDAELTKGDQGSSSSLMKTTQTLRNSIRGVTTQSVFRSDDGLRSAQLYEIRFSSAKIAQRSGSRKLLILDHVPCHEQGSNSMTQLTTNVRDLARKLLNTEPLQFGLLQCSCVIKEATSFTFVYKMIDGFSMPRSLRAAFLAGEAEHSLSDRLEIARQLAKSISFVHTLGFVHKNVRPENILIATDNPSSLGLPFLVGFQQFRAAEGGTQRFGDAMWERNLYRHPQRQGLSPSDDHIMQHDIYSLGVCLLEIGLWESFVRYNDDGTCVPSLALSELSGLSHWDPDLIKKFMVTYTQTVLPRRMGSKYASAVETCLTCLDKDNVDFGDESQFQDADGILVGVRYIEKVLVRLDDISI